MRSLSLNCCIVSLLQKAMQIGHKFIFYWLETSQGNARQGKATAIESDSILVQLAQTIMSTRKHAVWHVRVCECGGVYMSVWRCACVYVSVRVCVFMWLYLCLHVDSGLLALCPLWYCIVAGVWPKCHTQQIEIQALIHAYIYMYIHKYKLSICQRR